MNREADDICDLDPNKICDNCCKCLEQQAGIDEDGFKVISAQLASEPPEEDVSEQASAIAALFGGDEDGEEADSEELDPIGVPPELMAEWEAKLRESFRQDEEAQQITRLHGARKKRF